MTQAAQSSRPSQRERRKNLFMALTFVFLTLYTIVLAIDLLNDVNLLWLTATFSVIAMVCAFGWARLLDEAKLNAHYVAWYWGGSCGLMASSLVFLAMMPMLLTPGGVEVSLPPAFETVAANLAFVGGFALGMIPAVLGYLIWWGVMSARRG
jgi:hypothetical protein